MILRAAEELPGGHPFCIRTPAGTPGRTTDLEGLHHVAEVGPGITLSFHALLIIIDMDGWRRNAS